MSDFDQGSLITIFSPSKNVYLVDFDIPHYQSQKKFKDSNFTQFRAPGLKVSFLHGAPVIDGTLTPGMNYLLVFHTGPESRNWIGTAPVFNFDEKELTLLTSQNVDCEAFEEKHLTDQFGYTALFRINSEKWGVKWALECPYTRKLTYFDISSENGEIKNDTEKYRSKY